MKHTRGKKRLLAYIVTGLMLVTAILVLFRGQVYALADAKASEPELADVDPALRNAMEAAMHDAAKQGVRLRVVSGGRSLAEQQQLYDKAVAEHGSKDADRWAVPPNQLSAHVKGLAVDVGPVEGSAWLRDNGARYGLCQVYANEPWHFERTAKNGKCPALISDASAVEHI